jgi:hypothetical protein
VEETHAEGVLDCDKLPVVHCEALPDAEGDGETVADRHADTVPQGEGVVEADKEVVPEKVEAAHAEGVLDCD